MVDKEIHIIGPRVAANELMSGHLSRKMGFKTKCNLDLFSILPEIKKDKSNSLILFDCAAKRPEEFCRELEKYSNNNQYKTYIPHPKTVKM